MAKAHTLVDNFNDNSLDASRWGNTLGAQLQEVNGRVEVRTPSGQVQFHNYVSATTYDHTESRVHVELVRPPNSTYGAAAYLQARIDNNHRLQLQVTGALLNCDFYVGGVQTKLARVPYDPVRHRWLRLREWLGTAYWETSPDGEEWEVIASRSPSPIALTAVYLLFGAGGMVGSCASGPAMSNASPDWGLVSLTAVEEARMTSSKSAGSRLSSARSSVEYEPGSGSPSASCLRLLE